MRIPMMKQMAWYLAIAMFIIGVAPKAEAGFSPSGAIGLSTSNRSADLANIQKVIEQKMIRDRLEKYGLTDDEINGRLAQLNDQQVHNLALNLDQLKAGGDGLEVVIVLLVIAILVVVLIQLTGHKVIIK
jgi:hypothetical protein